MSHHHYKQQALELLKSIETGASKPAGYINPNKYIQHNLYAADGLQGFGELLQQLPPNSAKIKTARVFQDGDYVFTHTDYDFFGPKVGFDIFRFEDDKIVEHWDNLQETAPANPSGHTMTDGPTESQDLDQTEANKKLVRNFVEDIFINGKMDRFGNLFDGDKYLQHNPQGGDGVSGLGAVGADAGVSGHGVQDCADGVFHAEEPGTVPRHWGGSLRTEAKGARVSASPTQDGQAGLHARRPRGNSGPGDLKPGYGPRRFLRPVLGGQRLKSHFRFYRLAGGTEHTTTRHSYGAGTHRHLGRFLHSRVSEEAQRHEQRAKRHHQRYSE